jgi:hypothetical protein
MSSGLHPVWRDYRNRRRALAVVLAVIPVLAAAGMSLRALTAAGGSAQLLLSAWATSVVASALWFAGFRCPFCSRHFHWTWIIANPLSDRCLHCGFEKWRDPHLARAYGRR